MIIIDSNIWIFAENENSDEHEMATKKALDAIKAGSFGINIVIVSETFHKLSKILNAKEAHSRVKTILENPFAEWLDFTQEMAISAMSISLNEHIRINDALIAQQALRFKAHILTDNLKDFGKVRGLKIIPLR